MATWKCDLVGIFGVMGSFGRGGVWGQVAAHDSGLGEAGDEAADAHRRQHPALGGFDGGGRRQVFEFVYRRQRFDRAGAATRRAAADAFLPLTGAVSASCSAGAQTQAGEFGFGGRGQRVAVGLVVLEHVPGDQRQFAGGGHHRDVAVFLFGQPPEEDAERAGMGVAVLNEETARGQV
jgi:hypothetical protein